MGFFRRTVAHIASGARKAGGALKAFYEKEKPVVVAFAKKEAEAIKRGGEHLKTYVREHYPKVKEWLAKEKHKIVEAYHKRQISKQEMDAHIDRHEQHSQAVDDRHEELVGIAHSYSSGGYSSYDDESDYVGSPVREVRPTVAASPKRRVDDGYYAPKLDYGRTSVRSHVRRCSNGQVTVVRKHNRNCLMYCGKLYVPYNPRKRSRSANSSFLPSAWR